MLFNFRVNGISTEHTDLYTQLSRDKALEKVQAAVNEHGERAIFELENDPDFRPDYVQFPKPGSYAVVYRDRIEEF